MYLLTNSWAIYDAFFGAIIKWVDIFLYHHNEQQDQQYDKNYGLIPIFYYHGMYNTKKWLDYESITINFYSIWCKTRFTIKFPNNCMTVSQF